MKDTQIKIAFFTIPEYDKEQEWLRNQHKEGWKLVNASLPCFYKFERCQPEDVIYQLDFNQEGRSNRDNYIQMFEDCGWQYITEMAGYTYFRKPVNQMQQQEEIFCDDDSRMDMIERVFKGRMLPLIAIFFCIIIPQLFAQGSMNAAENKILFAVFVAMFILYISIFIKFGIQYWRLKNRVKS